MKTEYPFTHNNEPAMLLFSDTPGELSELIFNDYGPKATLIIKGYTFDEERMALLVLYKEQFFKQNGEMLTLQTDKTLDTLPQESVEYFMGIAITPPVAKRMEVNGIAIDRLKMTLFNSSTGAFDPQPIAPPTPAEPEPEQPE